MQTKTPRFQLAHLGSEYVIVSIYAMGGINQQLVIHTLVSFAISAHLVGLQLQEAFDGGLVLRRPVSGGVRRPSRHVVKLVYPRTAMDDLE
jgi:hypothetical protein